MVYPKLGAKVFFESLNKDTMHLVDEFYDENCEFLDPIVQLKGVESLRRYYANMYRNVKWIRWEIPSEIMSGHECALVWKMTLAAENFNKGNPVEVQGMSFIKFGGLQGKAIYHRDYFDMGSFVYEWVPILGGMVRFVKAKMAQHKQ